MNALVTIAVGLVDRLIGVLEKRANKPAPPPHGSVSDAQIDRLLSRAKGLKK